MVDIIYERCCGLDVHKDKIVACLLTPGANGGRVQRELRTFGAFTRDLLALGDWLGEAGCTHVAMESTGSYWKPVSNILEERFEVVVVNARHLKLIPGRKTDVKDAEWIADLFRHGLLRASFIPGRPQRELRELTRYRTTLVGERAAEVNRIQKVLEGANIKLGSVASNVMGVSGRAMLAAMVKEALDPVLLAALAQGALRKKQDLLVVALSGRVGPHQRFLLGEQLDHVTELDRRIARLDDEIHTRLGPDNEARDRLDEIPGVGRATAEVILSEVGEKLETFDSADRLCSWAGVVPGLNESAGKNRSGRAPKGNRSLITALVQAAHATRRTKTFLGTLYRRLAARIGPARGALAVAHRILRIAFNLLKHHSHYTELGADYHDSRTKERLQRRHLSALNRLGFAVSITPTS